MGFSRQEYWSGVPWCRKKTKWTLLNTSLRMKASFELKQFFIFIQIGKQLLKGSLGLIRPETESGNIKIKKMLCSWFFNILASPVFLTIQFFFLIDYPKNGLVVFPTFFNLSLILAIMSSWSEPQSAPSLVFADCIELLHLWLQRI